MISTVHKFLFIHVPKTGGNSIQNVLRDYSDDDVVCLAPHQDGLERFELRSSTYNTRKHSTFSEYRYEYGDQLVDSLFTFCCVRNPWDRCISHFFSPHRGNVEWSPATFEKFVKTEIKPLGWYLASHPMSGSLQHSLEKISFVIRFEHLQADFDVFTKKLSIPSAVLPHRNASSKKPYQGYYDSKSAHLVATKFAEEIELFGYSF